MLRRLTLIATCRKTSSSQRKWHLPKWLSCSLLGLPKRVGTLPSRRAIFGRQSIPLQMSMPRTCRLSLIAACIAEVPMHHFNLTCKIMGKSRLAEC